MKQTVMSKLAKQVISLSLSAVMLLGICLEFSNVKTVNAADSYMKIASASDISKYWTVDRKTAPDITELITDGSVEDKDWLFAGWYTNAECTKAWSNTASGTAYAKFIPTSTFTTLCQVLATTTGESTEASKLRMLMTVDSLQYAKIGFNLKLNGIDKGTEWTSTVYTSIRVADETNDVSFKKLPEEIDANAAYFATLTMVNIGKVNWTKSIFITPCWETQDGTIVEGMGRYARVEDAYKQIVNVPIRIYEGTKNVAAGLVQVAYDSKFTYVGCDAGTIFEEVQTGDNTVSQTVTCVGNVQDITQNKAAKGMYMNLRFSVSDLTELNATETFTISATEFCDIDEKTVTVDVANATSKNYNN